MLLTRVFTVALFFNVVKMEQPGSDSKDVNPMFLQQLRELDIPEEAAKQVGHVYKNNEWTYC